MPGKPKFGDNEKVLCYHGPLLYEAKCVKSRKDSSSKGDFQYFVHYQGWNKNWDEWVPENRILKSNSESYDRKEKLLASHNQKQLKDTKKKSKSGSKSGGPPGGSGTSTPLGGPPGSGSGGRGSANTSRASTPVSERSVKVGSKRTQADDEQSTSSREDETDKTPLSSGSRRIQDKRRRRDDFADPPKSRFQLDLPESLKSTLVQDWDLVTRNRQLLALPAKVTAASMVKDFLAEVKSRPRDFEGNPELYTEIMNGILFLFNGQLGKRLLYKFERAQFESRKKGETAEAYSGIHLLRLLVKLDPYFSMSSSVILDSDVIVIKNTLTKFVKFLDLNHAKYFNYAKMYSEAPESYKA